ncbi:nucleotide 5'-monophosphate nucleosidase PpnN [Pseudaeromonas paramecii]|uniref:AMP nucleosidase n=1 Tax=Pseudaeromonas paramecii TaxID=2138166 RepID=A0ABP8Q4E1_9GAMM
MITYINPVGSMEQLSQLEVDRLKQAASGATYQLFRNCSLAVLNSGSQTDSSKEILEKFANFEINVIRRERGVKLELFHAPDSAFVDGEIIRGIQEHLFSVLRDILYVSNKREADCTINLTSSVHITNYVFSILRNARTIHSGEEPNLVVCWGGHSINAEEYQYTREVGSELGLRELNVCTGCGPGAMEGPMKGAAVGHAKQRYGNRRYVGLTEPSIIAAEPPNPIVSELVIMPDIEKRLEAFVRIGHGIIIFPGGVGTAEELLYILGIMMNPANQHQPMPLVLTGPASSREYFHSLDEFIRAALGEAATRHYQIILDDPAEVARVMKQAMPKVREYRKAVGDAYSFNWSLKIEPEFQLPFEPSHEAMTALNLHWEQPPQQLAANLRRAFSGIVAGNVKEAGLKAIERKGPFQLNGDKTLMAMMDKLLQHFVAQGRMKLPGSHYQPCYEIIR